MRTTMLFMMMSPLMIEAAPPKGAIAEIITTAKAVIPQNQEVDRVVALGDLYLQSGLDSHWQLIEGNLYLVADGKIPAKTGFAGANANGTMKKLMTINGGTPKTSHSFIPKNGEVIQIQVVK